MILRINTNSLYRWLFGILISVEIGLVALDALVSEYDLISIGAAQRLVNITREDGIPNFFSSFQMVLVATVVLMIALVARQQMASRNSRVPFGWGILTGFFYFIAFDDGVKLHERLGTIFKALVTDSRGEGNTPVLGQIYEAFPSYTWQIAVGPVFVVLGLFVLVFLLRQLDSTRLKTLAMCAIGLFAIAQGMDFLEGMDSSIIDRIADLFDTTTGRVTHFSKSVEEFLEMFGTTLFLYVFLSQLAVLTRSITFELNERQE